jgi:hypothetical protein
MSLDTLSLASPTAVPAAHPQRPTQRSLSVGDHLGERQPPPGVAARVRLLPNEVAGANRIRSMQAGMWGARSAELLPTEARSATNALEANGRNAMGAKGARIRRGRHAQVGATE